VLAYILGVVLKLPLLLSGPPLGAGFAPLLIKADLNEAAADRSFRL